MNQKRKGVSAKTWKEWCWGWAFIAPTIIGLLVLNIIPIFQTLYLSFFKSGAFGKGNLFVGLNNYKQLFSDPQVWYASATPWYTRAWWCPSPPCWPFCWQWP